MMKSITTLPMVSEVHFTPFCSDLDMMGINCLFLIFDGLQRYEADSFLELIVMYKKSTGQFVNGN